MNRRPPARFVQRQFGLRPLVEAQEREGQLPGVPANSPTRPEAVIRCNRWKPSQSEGLARIAQRHAAQREADESAHGERVRGRGHTRRCQFIVRGP